MIHFLPLDQTTSDFTAPAPPPPPAPRLPFRLPAEYYASPERHPVLPRAMPFGCGGAAILFLVVLFTAGANADKFMPELFGVLQTQLDTQFTKDVTPAQRAEFDREFDTFRARMEHGRANLAAARPFLEKMRDATIDERITPAEAKELTEALRKANGR